MNENPFIGAYWSSREETRRQCAERAVTFLRSVEIYPGLGQWFLKKRSRKESVSPLEVTVQGIEQCLKSNNRDGDGTAIHDLGFTLGLWNGAETTSSSLSITCGASSKFIKNSLVLNLPPAPPPADPQSFEAFHILLEKVVAAWDPDNAVATSTEFLNRSGGGMPWVAGGWVTYHRGVNLSLNFARQS
jgi:hypothetical protein